MAEVVSGYKPKEKCWWQEHSKLACLSDDRSANPQDRSWLWVMAGAYNHPPFATPSIEAALYSDADIFDNASSKLPSDAPESPKGIPVPKLYRPTSKGFMPDWRVPLECPCRRRSQDAWM